MSSSYSAGSASSSGGGSGQQLGARPKIARQLLLQQQQQQQQQQQMNKSVNRSSAGQSRTSSHHHSSGSSSSKENKEWNSNWNSILSAQGNERPMSAKSQQSDEMRAIKSNHKKSNNIVNGQPPSTVKSHHNHPGEGGVVVVGRDGMLQWKAALQPAVSRGFSDPSLAVVQPVASPATNSGNGRQKSPELFHSHHYHARRQRDRQHLPNNNNNNNKGASRSNSAADLSSQSSSHVNLSSNASSLNNVNTIQDSSSGGISSIWARWFRRNNNRTSAAAGSIRPFSSSYYYGGGAAVVVAGSRSHSVENSPVVSRRRHPMTGSSGQLANSDNSDSLSTNSFSFIRADNDPALTLRRKYGLMACSNESTDKMGHSNNHHHNNFEGDAIRAMRTQWETQMKQMDEILRNNEEDNNKCSNKRASQANNSTTRKKRPAPQPPPSSASSRQSTSNRAGSVASSGFTHVPGKRKAPSPPDQSPVTTNTFNISVPPPPVVLPDLMESTPAPEASPLAESKWSNDLNSNLLLDENNKVKVFRYHQNKFEDCPHNDILKLEGGVLRPLDSSNCKAQPAEASGSTMDSNHRGMMMTLPLKPWYKRGRNSSASQLHHQHSSANAATRSKWKDAALLHHSPPPPLLADECNSWAMGLVATHLHHLHHPLPPPESSSSNTMRSNYSSTVSPGGSTRSEGSVCSSDGSKGKQQQQQQHRKSLLVNISQLDREASEIIQRERARESQRRKMEDEKFYCGTSSSSSNIHPSAGVTTTIHLATVPDVPDESPPRDSLLPDGQQQQQQQQQPPKCARELINMFNSLTDSPPSINSQETKQQTGQPQPEKADANYKTGQTYSKGWLNAQTVNVPADHQPATTANASSRLLLAADESTASIQLKSLESPMNSNTITRLRVNRETVAAASPETLQQQQQQQQQSIFNPKLEVVIASAGSGGARPKHSPSSSSSLIENKSSALVNGYSKPTTTTTTTTTMSNGWACQVCTLVNSEARLWCEACTALKPRQFNKTTTTTTTTTITNGVAPPVVKETATKIIPKSPEVTAVAPSLLSSTSSSTSPSNLVVTTPNSPEALRQARLAFFLNGQQQGNNNSNNNNNNKPEMKIEVQASTDDRNNNMKRHSQPGGVKVSSSCQTGPFSPSLITTPKFNSQSTRPVSMLNDKKASSLNPSDPSCNAVVSHSRGSTTNVNDSVVVVATTTGPLSSTNANKRVVVPPAVFKDVNPTNFALVSPSRTQLSQYLQQQQASKNNNNQQQQAAAAGSTNGEINDVHKSTDDLSDELSEDKRVEVMLLRLEEAIAAGQFDKAAVLAKELAAIKRTPSPASPVSSKPAVEILPAIISKPVAAPRSVVPVVVAQQQSEPVKSSPVPARRDNPVVSAAPLPAKRLSHLSSPSPLPRKSIRPEEKAEETIKPEEEEKPVVIDDPPPVQPEEPVNIAQPQETASAVPVKKSNTPTPEVTVRTKRRSVKVSSGQQTTLTFQKKSSANAEETNQRRTRSCIVDDTFNVEVFIEDRSTHSGPFQLPVRPSTTLLELKERMAKTHDVKAECQRWILGRRLANQDQFTLKDYDICPSNSSLFLYVLNDPNPPPKLKINQLQPDPVQSEPQPINPPQATNNASRRYYNYQEDRYSTCEEEDDEPLEAAGLTNGPVINTELVNKIKDFSLTEQTTTDEQRPPEMEQGATGGLDPIPAGEERKVDYKKLVDLLDQSDVVTNAETFDCPVCLMTVPAGVGVTLRECLHNFCRDCLAHVIEFSDEATVTCPYRDDNYACDAILQELEIKNLVGAKLYEKHLERSMRLAEKAMKNTFHCQTADCPGWAIIEEDNVNVFRCPVCRKSNCLTCQAIHEGANCKEFQDRVNQSAETDEDARRTKEMIDALVASGEALSCPQCQVVLMKRWGCDWVRCSVCRTEICWVTKQNRWGPKGKGDTSGGCRCGVDGVKCHPLCNYCH